ncbi:MAG: SDR family NAD(P)-dependent oxidoreductase [Alphaproteobacteria bacterium]
MLKGKTILVTGAARGMGASDAEFMLHQGAAVVITDINAELGRATEKRLSNLGPCTFMEHDVTDPAAWQRVVAATIAKHGQLDALVNNAGLGGRASIESTSLETWRKALDVNATGVFLGMQSVFPHMKERRRGSIVNIASMSGLVAARYPNVELTPNAGYYTAKAGVVVLTKLGATQFGPHGVRVNAVCPGVIKTDMSADSFADPERVAFFKAVIPFDRVGAPADVAHAVAFLASDLSGFINGVALPVDGGQTAKS